MPFNGGERCPLIKVSFNNDWIIDQISYKKNEHRLTDELHYYAFIVKFDFDYVNYVEALENAYNEYLYYNGENSDVIEWWRKNYNNIPEYEKLNYELKFFDHR